MSLICPETRGREDSVVQKTPRHSSVSSTASVRPRLRPEEIPLQAKGNRAHPTITSYSIDNIWLGWIHSRPRSRKEGTRKETTQIVEGTTTLDDVHTERAHRRRNRSVSSPLSRCIFVVPIDQL
mmetsp:Transcript_19499/g.45351  ORF Transcript_19499/g.45351 Transcript_19499/m.45351 type:complete len:124 (+) Transcript_19499:1571-1942(+)